MIQEKLISNNCKNSLNYFIDNCVFVLILNGNQTKPIKKFFLKMIPDNDIRFWH